MAHIYTDSTSFWHCWTCCFFCVFPINKKTF